MDCETVDIYPVGWGELVGHKLEGPRQTREFRGSELVTVEQAHVVPSLLSSAPQRKEKKKPVGRKGKKRSSNGQQTTPPSSNGGAAGTSSTASVATAGTTAGSFSCITGFSSEIGTKLRDWAVGQAGGSCYSRAALSSNDSKTR